ncbi:MAG TPA: 1-hydroxycarotenoid 3,4-desaturase CrtD [Polyangiaceae bacterium]|nr:1-hydroxycarotenoid 3,4-desaturase CrtD [Polyangiaceae bacterium]
MKAVVIGSGIAGLASAIRLQALGVSVTVLEANSYPGGKLTSIERGGYRWDAGPSLFTMPELVLDLFRSAGKEPAGRFSYKRKEIGCHYFYPDGTFLRAYTDPARFAAEAERVLGVPVERVRRYLAHSERIYHLVGRIFLEKPLNRWDTWATQSVARALFHAGQLDLGTTLHEANLRRLGEPRLVQYFDRMATYNGSSPYRAPGILAIIPHLEHNVGTFIPEGGMISITNSLITLAKELGVVFEFDTAVTRIRVEQAKASGVVARGEYIPSDLVVCNMDIVPAYRQLMPEQPAPARILSQERSSSAVIFYWGIRKRVEHAELHNIFFASDYPAEFRAIFEQGNITRDPTVYVNATVKDIPSDAPEGCENWFVMVNAPPNTGQDWDAMLTQLRRDVLAKLEQHLGERIEPYIEVEQVLDPRGIEQRTSSYQGALYGTSSNSMWSAFLRHPNVAHRIQNLYFCGGSVHPGGGIPLCLNSAKIATDCIRRDHAL